MRFTHDQRIARAAELADSNSAAREVLEFYSGLARLQKRIFDDVSARLETQVESLERFYPELLELLRRSGPFTLAEAGGRYTGGAALRDLLTRFWNGEMMQDWFFARALVEPFAESLALRGTVDPQWMETLCPFCSARAGVAVLRGEGDGGKRSLICSLCSTEWQFRRILCPNCGEENKDKLPVYVAEEFAHVRMEACDACKCYIKAVDLTTNGRAVPVVDEIATIPLNIWAEEHGYVKIAPNLLGM